MKAKHLLLTALIPILLGCNSSTSDNLNEPPQGIYIDNSLNIVYGMKATYEYKIDDEHFYTPYVEEDFEKIDFRGNHVFTVRVAENSEGKASESISFHFSKYIPDTPQLSIDDNLNRVIGMENIHEYRLDENTEYTAYNEEDFDNLDFSGDHTLYIRVMEAEDNYTSEHQTLTFTTNPDDTDDFVIFDDPDFESLIKDVLNKSQNSSVRKSEILQIEEIVLINKEINSWEDFKHLENLEKLSLRYCRLSNIDLSYLTNLKHLDLFASHLDNIILSEMKSLEFLDLSYNNFEFLELKDLNMLHTFYATANSLKSCVIENLSSLKTLDVSYNQLTTLDISKLQNLEEIDARSNLLETFFTSNEGNLKNINVAQNSLTSINNIEKYEEVDISYNNFSEISISESFSLKSISLGNKGMESLKIENLDTLETLEVFSLDNCTIEFNDLENIINLNIINSKINNKIDMGIFSNIANLTLKGNDLTELSLINFPNLSNIDIQDEKDIVKLKLENLPNLKSFSRIYSKLEVLEISNLDSLETIELHDNHLTSLNLSDFPKLATIDINEEENLVSLNLSNLPGLIYFSRTYSELENLFLSKLDNLKEIELHDNNISELIIEDFPKLETIDINGERNITSLTLASLPRIYSFSRKYTDIETINIINLEYLNELDLRQNHIKTMQITNLTSLTSLQLSSNDLDSLGFLDEAPYLEEIYLYNNLRLNLNEGSEDYEIINYLKEKGVKVYY